MQLLGLFPLRKSFISEKVEIRTIVS